MPVVAWANCSVPGPAGPGTEMPIGVERGVNDVRLALAHVLIPQAEFFEFSGTIVLRHDIGGVHQLPENIAALGGFEVKQDTALAPVNVVVGLDIAAATGVVDLDDIGAEFRQGPTA